MLDAVLVTGLLALLVVALLFIVACTAMEPSETDKDTQIPAARR